MLRLAFLLLTSAFASSFYEQPFPETVREAPTIVRGKIGKSETQWTTLPDGSKHLFTYYDVEVSESFKGSPRTGGPIRIREIGGSKDGVSLNVSGTANFETGEDVVVMLGEASSSGDGAYPVVGMMMGKFNLEKGADGKEYLRGPGLGSSIHPKLRNEHSDDKMIRISLDGMREIIRTQASEMRASPSPGPALPFRSKDSLLSDQKGNQMPVVRTELHDEGIAVSNPKSVGPVKIFVLIAGFLIGGAWFLKSRKKRR